MFSDSVDEGAQQSSIENKPAASGSKLAQLAKSRANAKLSVPSINQATASSKLTALAKARSGQKMKEESNNHQANTSNKSLQILGRLRSSTATDREKSSPRLSLPKTNGLKGFSSGRLNKLQHNTEQTQPEIAKPKEVENIDIDEPPKQHQEPEVSFNIVYDDSILLKLPNTPVSSFLFNKRRRDEDAENHLLENRIKRRHHNDELFHPITNNEIDIATTKKVKSNFDEPSPDDEIINAQKNAFEKNMGNLKISEERNNSSSTVDTITEKQPPKKTQPFKKIELSKELSTHTTYLKPHKSFVVIGHVDAGKSTLMGRLLFDLGIIDAKTVNNLVRQSEKLGKGSFALAWIMDQTSEERSRGVTVDICATNFETETSRFTAIDAPGHKDFVPQMISGVSQADLALLVIDSITGEFESGFTMDGQTKEHTILARNLGIAKVCVVVNKMDKEDWSERRFEDIKFQMTEFLTGSDIGFSSDQIDFVPISGLTGNNVVKTDTSIKAFDWYKGPTLSNYLENIRLPDQIVDNDLVSKLIKEDFNMSINDIYSISSSEFGVSGKITSGMIQAGETVSISPNQEYLQIQSLSIHDKPVNVGISGEIVLMNFKINQLTNKTSDDLSIGDLILKIDSPITAVKTFIASIHLFNMNKPLLVGTPFVLFRNNSHIPARISKIVDIEGSKKKKKHLISKQSATVEITVQGDRLLPVTRFSDNKILGRVVIRREGVTVGAGTISDL
ncbi:unnamed protein product [Debaryomyces tyrocola]|nr:unnamed protein product [Debaryomyces tyrocola]